MVVLNGCGRFCALAVILVVVVVVLLGEHVNNFKNIYILNWLFSLL